MSAKMLNYILFASLGFVAVNEVAANCLYSNEDRVSRLCQCPTENGLFSQTYKEVN